MNPFLAKIVYSIIKFTFDRSALCTMKAILESIIRLLITIPSMVIIWFLVYFSTNHLFFATSVSSLIAGLFIYQCTKWVRTGQFIKQQKISRKEYRFILKNLKEAKYKIRRLQKTFFSIRDIRTFKLYYDINKIVRKIYSLIQKEPRRFYLAESFFYVHLNSMVELSEKFSLLNAQPVKNKEIIQNIDETRHTLKELTHEIEKDLYSMLKRDIDDLHFELEYAKHSIDQNRPLTREERRKKK